MAEDNGSATPGDSQTGAPPAVTPEVVTFVNPDGTFKDGWQDKFIPEDFRPLGVYKTVTDVPSAMKRLGELEKLRGKQGKGIMPLTPDSTPTERDLFYKALGRPDKPDDYKWEAPKELAQYYPAETLKDAMGELHKAGLTQEQVASVLALDVKRTQTGLESMQKAQEAAVEQATIALKAKWGEAYDERIHLANRMIAENVAEADRPAILEKIGNDPIVADFLATIGKKFTEGKIVNTDQAPGKMTPAEAKLKMDELIGERLADMNMKSNNPAKFKRLSDEINRLAALAMAGQ